MIETISYYTDGACSTNGTWDGGAGVYAEHGDDQMYYFKSAVDTTNNKMELEAFNFALSLGLDCKDKQVIIYTDSAYIVNAFKQDWISNWIRNDWKNSRRKPVKNKELWVEAIDLMAKYHKDKIEIKKVKGHSNNFGNNVADALAVMGRDAKDKLHIWRTADVRFQR